MVSWHPLIREDSHHRLLHQIPQNLESSRKEIIGNHVYEHKLVTNQWAKTYNSMTPLTW